MANFLYTLIISPLVQIIEIAYILIYKVFNSPSIAIIGVSVAVTFLCLPLYVVAEKWQQTERDTAAKLKPKIAKIKAAFKGDEQYLILSTYYRQNHYHPLYTLRSSFGILIQIPFFIAAYSYLSHLEALKGVSFLFIHDLSLPDTMMHIDAFTVNILPIAMTAINIAAGAIYSRGFPVKEKVQLYGMAAVFLALLYNSPAGLVLYWTMNNILSLVKNIFYKLKNPLRVLYILLVIFITLAIVYLLCFNTGSFKKRLLLALCCAALFFIPLALKCVTWAQEHLLFSLTAHAQRRTLLFILSCTTLVLLTGLCIPSGVIASSPEEFSFIDSYTSPFPFLVHSVLKGSGFFLFWPLCVYALFGDHVKNQLAALFSAAVLPALANTFAFQGAYGTITNTFTFNSPSVLISPGSAVVLNAALLVLLFITLLVVLRLVPLSAINAAGGIIAASLIIFSAHNLVAIQSGYNKTRTLNGDGVHALSPVFSLSKDKANVVIVMADRAISSYVLPIFAEHPALGKQFDGFTLYPNTVSFANHTLIGVPPVWGGYEYTPHEINARSNVPLVQKHNEALLLLPRIFADSCFQVTVSDPSWANYSWIPDTSIYAQYENITALNTINHYSGLWYERRHFGNDDITAKKIERNMLWFSFLKIFPLSLRIAIYDDGLYWSPENIGDSIDAFINSYAVLDFLSELTGFDAEKPSALFLTNDTTHESIFLQYPGYTPTEQVTNRGSGPFSADKNYHGNSAFYLMFGKWLDTLKAAGVYDNTRIIIVSDHGAGIPRGAVPNAETLLAIPTGEQRTQYQPLLLVKDFDAHGEIKTDMTFMTNADVPVLATNGIVDHPVNPFTGNAVTNELKQAGVFITTNNISMPFRHQKNVFNIKDDQWIHVHDNIFDEKNWEKAK
ncbi:membrane protein [Spirochaetia bacterium]|nr:membrane protein [Spirochaetia bacterium]